MTAAGALEAMGVDPSELAPARKRALGNTNPWVRFVAAEGLIGHAPPPVLLPPILDYYLRDGDAEFMDLEGASAATRRRPPLTALARTQDRALLPPLVDALRPGTPGRKGMLRVLAVFEPPAGWRDILIELLALMDTPTQGEAIAQLKKHGRSGREGVGVPRRTPDGEPWPARPSHVGLAVAGPVAHEHAGDRPGAAEGQRAGARIAAETLGKIGDRSAPGTQAEKGNVARWRCRRSRR